MSAPKKAELTFAKNVTTEQIHEAVKLLIEGIRPEGCMTCGILGWDLTLRGVDPSEFEKVSPTESLEGVLSVGLSG
jgi:hypothetical protein